METPERELLLLGARVRASAAAAPVEALLVRGGRVRALGGEAELRRRAAPGAQVIDLAGATVVPGLVDAHLHPTAWALARRRAGLHGARGPDEAVARVRAAAAAADAAGWVLGQGWSQHLLGALPTREALDRALPGRPVFLDSADLHAAWLSGEALRRCGIDRHTPDPPAGRVVRDAAGEPTGVLLEEARQLALAHLPEPGLDEIVDALESAQAELHRLGITGFHSVEPTGLRDLEALRARGRLRLRVLQHLPLARLDDALALGLRSGFGGEWIRVGGVKMFLDGSLGSRTARLREPYAGAEAEEERGIQTLSDADFRDAVRRAAEGGLASTVHAIGDAAVELALRVLGEVPPPAALPHRVEHLQLCPPELWAAPGRAGIVASMQPVHLLSDVPAAERHWGHERSRGAYAFAPLLRAGAVLAFGSDAPVETPDPRPGLLAATRRVTWAGPWRGGEWYPENALSPAEALAAYTEGPALAAGLPRRAGTLHPGGPADLVAWDADPLELPPRGAAGDALPPHHGRRRGGAPRRRLSAAPGRRNRLPESS